MEVALQEPGPTPDINTGSAHQDHSQAKATYNSPNHASVQQGTQQSAPEPCEPSIATDQNVNHHAASDLSLQLSAADHQSLESQADDFSALSEGANGQITSMNNAPAIIAEAMMASAQGMKSSDRHVMAQNTLDNTSLAMHLPLPDDIAPGALHSDLGAEMMPLSSHIDTDALQSMDELDLTAYAKLEFPDATYLVRTLSVELGRDNSAKRRAKRMAAQLASESESQSRPSSAGDAGRTPMRQDSRPTGGCHAFSEEGGIMRWNESSSDSNQRVRSKKGKKSKSPGNEQKATLSGSQYEAAVAAANIGDQRHAYPPYDACPLLPIHIPDSFGPDMDKGISRKHARIEYNSNKELFELHALSRNGIFINTVFYAAGSTIPLHHGDVIQVGPVAITFGLPSNVVEAQQEDSDASSEEGEEGMNGVNGQSSVEASGSVDDSGQELVKTIESGERSPQDSASEEQAPPKQRTKLKFKALPSRHKPRDAPAMKSKDSKSAAAQKDAKRAKNQKSEKPTEFRREKKKEKDLSTSVVAEASTAQHNGPEGAQSGMEIPPKRKGPGRPPKDGIMSKRERQARAKQAKEADRARKFGLPPPPPLDLKTKTEKKREMRKEEEDASATARSSTADAEKPTASSSTPVTAMASDQTPSGDQPKPAKVPKPPARSPSPEMKESDFTEEQLARPAANYITLIHEAITNSKNGQMNLQQIYSAIERKYPFYKFKVGTTGWQSSVRHNLGQNTIFQKVEKEGKGYLWAVKEGATPENQKRKRSPPPPAPQHPYYPPTQYPGMHGGPGQPRPSAPAYPQYSHRPPYPAPPPAPPTVVAPPAQTSGNYSSPYAVNPALSAARACQAPSNPANGPNGPNGMAYSLPQQPGVNMLTVTRPVSSVPHPSSHGQNSVALTPSPSLATLMGEDYPKHLPIALPGGRKTLDPDIITRWQKFKDVFVEVSASDKQHCARLVSSAVKRIFYPGLITDPFERGEEDIVRTLTKLIEDKTSVASVEAAHTQHAAVATTAPPPSRPATPQAPTVEPLTPAPAPSSPPMTTGDRDRDVHKRDRETEGETSAVEAGGPSEKRVRTESSEGE